MNAVDVHHNMVREFRENIHVNEPLEFRLFAA